MDCPGTVSVVIPVYNRSTLICRCLDSVRAQTFRPVRIIVVDNNSTDDTPEVVKDWIKKNSEPSLKVDLLHEATPGASAARNRGLANVDSTYTLFFDSDDVMHPDLISEAVEAIGNADLVYWKAEVVGIDCVTREKPFHSDNLMLRQFFNSQLSTQQYMARTDQFRRIGGWNPEAKVWNDWELGIRIAMSGIKVATLPKTLVTIYAQENSITGRRFHDKKGEWEKTLAIVGSEINKANIQESSKTLLNKALSYTNMVLAAHYAREGFPEQAEIQLSEATANLSTLRRCWLRLLYFYTKKGGRGAYYLWLPLKNTIPIT